MKQEPKQAKARPRRTASAADRIAAGKALRDKIAYDRHGGWRPQTVDRDPIALLRAADKTRLPELVPIRYGRMLQSPFTFYRGSAAVMAADLAVTPVTDVHVQCCGDAHLMNFGGFATPERRLIFDINDLDETLPAPWEWDLKRLAASFVLAARSNGLPDGAGRDAAVAATRSYRKRMRAFADMNVLDIWYSRIDAEALMEGLSADRQAFFAKRIEKATAQGGSDIAYPKLVEESGQQPRIKDLPPTIFHPDVVRDAAHMEAVREALKQYRETVPEDRRLLLDRYTLVDLAVKVVGIGSVGTICMVGLLMSVRDDPLFLQFKEANASVLEPFAGKSAYEHHGQRVVMGQRLMQPASDMFLGWVTGPGERHFYVRQLRDAKISPLVETFDAEVLQIYARFCGFALARAHAKAGDPWTISGYLGKHDEFDAAIGRFAVDYADQAEKDHGSLKAAVRAGIIDVRLEG
ncbi:MAG: DUF2252 domain-containing protein [Amaricoccus sp.]